MVINCCHCCHFLIKKIKDVSKHCNLLFKSANQLKKHKAEELNIQKRDGAKNREKGKPKDGQNQFRIDNLFVPFTNFQTEEANNEEETNDRDEMDNEIDDDSNDHDDNGDYNDEDDDDDEKCKLCQLFIHFKIYRR